MKTTALVLGTALIPLSASAGYPVDSEFKATLSNRVFNQTLDSLLSGVTGQNSGPLPDIQVHDPAEVSITGLQVSLDYSFPKPVQTDDPRVWLVQADRLAASLRIQKVVADKTVTQQIGGIDITVRLHGECSNVELTLPAGAAQAQATVKASLLGDHIQFDLQDFSATWEPGSWTVVSMDCSGPDGFGAIIADEALTRLRSIAPFLGQIEDQLKARLSTLSATPLASLFPNPPAKSTDLYQVDFEVQSAFDLNSGSVMIGGIAHFVFPTLNAGGVPATAIPLASGSPLSPPADGSGDQSSLLLPYRTTQLLLLVGQALGELQADFSTQDIPAFSSFMNNRIAQFFVWRDLLYFGTKAVFKMRALVSGGAYFWNPEQAATNDGTLSGILQAPLTLQVYAPKDGAYVHYLDFTTSLSQMGSLQLKGGVLSLHTTDPNISLGSTWNPDYVKRYHPDQTIHAGEIAKVAGPFLRDSGLSHAVPAFSLGALGTIAPSEWKLENGDLRVFFDVKP